MLSGSQAAGREVGNYPLPTNHCPLISVCHIISGDLWAGAEAQAAALLNSLSRDPALQLSAILLNEGRLTEAVRKCNIPVKVIPESETSFLGIVNQATRYLHSPRVQVLHSHRYKENLLAAALARRCRIPIVVRTEHGVPEPFKGVHALKQRVLRQADRLVAQYATDCVISVSAELDRRLARYSRRGKIAIIPNGLDMSGVTSSLSVADAKKRLGISANSPVLGYAGRLAPVKRLDIFVAAAAEIARSLPEAKFVIAGEGSERSVLRQAVAAAGLEDRFLFVGHRDDVYDVMRAFDVFILSSDHEGLPIVLLEALYLGVPVVARRVGGIPEVIEHGTNGLLVDSPDPHVLAEACLHLLARPDLRSRLGTAGTLRVREHFSAARAAAQTAELYRSLVDSGQWVVGSRYPSVATDR